MLFCKATVVAFFCIPTCFKNLNHKISKILITNFKNLNHKILPFNHLRATNNHKIMTFNQLDENGYLHNWLFFRNFEIR